MPNLETLRIDMLNARKTGDVEKVNILGLVIASITNFKIEVQRELTEEDIQTILRKEEKKLKEALDQFTSNGRLDLAKKEEVQLKIVQNYLPKLMDRSEIEAIVKTKLSSMGEVSAKDLGKVMGMMMTELRGKADGNEVNEVVKALILNK